MTTSDSQAKGMKCPFCKHAVVVKAKLTNQAPGHEEHDGSSTTIIASGKVGKNKRCPCGSGRAYSKCCGKEQ